MKNNTILKRGIAYLIDLFVVTIIASGITYLGFINPSQAKYEEYSEEYRTLMDKYYDKEITIEEFNDKSQDLVYDINKNGYVFIIGELLIIYLYFSGFTYITKGQTLGKKIMGIKIVKKDGGNPKIYQYIIRTSILNGIFMNIVVLIALCFSKKTYFSIYNIASTINSILMIILIFSTMFSKEERGLHDIASNTKVIDIRKPNIEEAEIKEIETKEEDVLEEKENNKAEEIEKKESTKKVKKKKEEKEQEE